MSKRNQIGLTIVEVQFAFLLLLIAVLALLGLMPTAIRQATNSNSHAKALFAATQTLEDCLRRNTHGDQGTMTAPEVNATANVRWYTTPGTNSHTETVHVEVTWLDQNRPLRLELKKLDLLVSDRKRGLTLVEVLVVLVLVAVFGGVAVGSLKMAFGHYGMMAQRFRAAQKARFVLHVMQNELRQGLPWRDPVDGYLRIGPNADPTALLMPNSQQPTSTELEFTEPHPDYYFPLDVGWNSEAPRNFRNVTYRVRGGTEVLREVRDHDVVPAPPAEVEVIASLAPRADGQPAFELEFRFLDANLCELAVVVRAGDATQSLGTRCFIVGR